MIDTEKESSEEALKPPDSRGLLGQPFGLRTNSLTRIYSQGEVSVVALKDLSIEIAPGEFVAITGPSGCGKSTLLHLLGGLDQATEGQVLAAGAALEQLPPAELEDYRLQRVGTIFQFFNLIPTLNALDNVGLPMTLAGVPVLERLERAQWLLSLVELEHRASFLPGRLAGGEQQRVAIARALANRPGVILADEPTGNLDSTSGEQVLGLLSDLNNRGSTIVIVTHDPEVARRADRVIRLRDGLLVADSGSPRRTIRAPQAAPQVTRFSPRDAFSMGLSEASRRPLRTALTMGGAVLGIALALLILSLQNGPTGLASVFLSLVALLTAGFGIVNTMFTAVVDRTRDIGVMKALGARVLDIWMIFLAEATVIGVGAAIIGPILAFLLAFLGNQLVGNTAFSLNFGIVVVGAILAVLLSLTSGLLPAWRAAQMRPTEALRAE